MTKTAEQIVELAEKRLTCTGRCLTDLGQRQIINRLFRAQDDSNLWPINGRFSVVERAIRHAQKLERDGGAMSSLEYALFIEAEESRIVNDPRNQ